MQVSAPLAVLHCMLSDLACSLLLRAARTVAQQLTGPRGTWEGHATVQDVLPPAAGPPAPSTLPAGEAGAGPAAAAASGGLALRTGSQVLFWQQAVLLLPLTSSGSDGGPADGTPAAVREVDKEVAVRPMLQV